VRGIARGVTAIVGQNIGAGLASRARAAVWHGVYMYCLFGSPYVALMLVNPDLVSQIFVPVSVAHGLETVEFSNHLLRIVSHSLIPVGITSILFAVYEGAGRTYPTMIVNVVRLWIIRLPLMCALGFRFGGDGLWWAISISNYLGIVFGLGWFALSKRSRSLSGVRQAV